MGALINGCGGNWFRYFLALLVRVAMEVEELKRREWYAFVITCVVLSGMFFLVIIRPDVAMQWQTALVAASSSIITYWFGYGHSSSRERRSRTGRESGG